MKVSSIYFGLYFTLGDVVVTTAILRKLKEKYPDVKITYAVGKDYVDLLLNNPDISEIIPCGSPQEIILRSKEKEYDKVFLPLQLTEEDSTWHQRPPYCLDDGLKNHNLVDFYATRCQDDLEITERKTFLYPRDEDWEEICNSAQDKKEEFQKTPFITVHTTSRNQTKDWPYEKWVEFTQKLIKKYGPRFAVYQVGGDNDKALLEPVKNLRGLPLRYTMAMIKRSSLHIDGDSGPSHIADALNVPTVCIMGSSASYNSGPIGPNIEFIEPNRKCIGTATHCACIASKCLINENCINTISVDEVLEVVSKKLDKIFG